MWGTASSRQFIFFDFKEIGLRARGSVFRSLCSWLPERLHLNFLNLRQLVVGRDCMQSVNSNFQPGVQQNRTTASKPLTLLGSSRSPRFRRTRFDKEVSARDGVGCMHSFVEGEVLVRKIFGHLDLTPCRYPGSNGRDSCMLHKLLSLPFLQL